MTGSTLIFEKNKKRLTKIGQDCEAIANYLLRHAEYEDREECLALTGSLDRLAPDL